MRDVLRDIIMRDPYKDLDVYRQLRDPVGWWNSESLFDLDLASGYAWYQGQLTTLTEFLNFNSGVRSGNTITLAPKVVGAELIADPGFDSGITGWANGVTFEAVGVLSWDSTNKRLHVNVAGRAGNTVVLERCSIPVTVTVGKAYRFQLRTLQDMGVGAGNIGFNPNNSFGGKDGDAAVAHASGELISDYASASAATMYLAAHTNNTTVDEYWDDQSVREVVPLVGHNYQEISGIVKGTTPTAASGNKVVFQADTNDERNRVRLVWDSSKHLRLIVTNNNTEQANLDLGVVEVSTAFEVRFSCTTNGFKANLNGGAIVNDTSGNHPGLAFLRIGRSFTGETWDGSISRVTLFAKVMSDADMTDPTKAFMIYGDSTAHGDGSGVTLTWFEGLRTAYDPDRSVYNAGVGGETTTQMLARVQADTDHRNWTTIFMDRPNTGESSSTWIANMKAAVVLLQTGRWLVVPPVLNSPSGLPDSSATAINEIQPLLLSDPFFAGHTFPSSQQAAYITAMADDATRVSADWVHFNNAGQALQASYIKTFMDAQGW